MDTKRVRELLKAIEKEEKKEAVLEKAANEAQARLDAQRRLTLDSKQELAASLRDVLVRKPRGAAGRQAGLSAALMAALKDGKPRSAADLRKTAEKKGMNAETVGMALGYLLKKGRIIRTGRAMYRKKTLK